MKQIGHDIAEVLYKGGAFDNMNVHKTLLQAKLFHY
jgi:hypothetical protein